MIAYVMDPRIVTSLIGAILFLVMASAPVYACMRSCGVKNANLSLVIQSAIVGALTYLSVSVLL